VLHASCKTTPRHQHFPSPPPLRPCTKFLMRVRVCWGCASALPPPCPKAQPYFNLSPPLLPDSCLPHPPHYPLRTPATMQRNDMHWPQSQTLQGPIAEQYVLQHQQSTPSSGPPRDMQHDTESQLLHVSAIGRCTCLCNGYNVCLANSFTLPLRNHSKSPSRLCHATARLPRNHRPMSSLRNHASPPAATATILQLSPKLAAPRPIKPVSRTTAIVYHATTASQPCKSARHATTQLSCKYHPKSPHQNRASPPAAPVMQLLSLSCDLRSATVPSTPIVMRVHLMLTPCKVKWLVATLQLKILEISTPIPHHP
jgi:hypothetical protein